MGDKRTTERENSITLTHSYNVDLYGIDDMELLQITTTHVEYSIGVENKIKVITIN